MRDVEAETTTVVAVGNGCRRPRLSADGRVLTYIRAGKDGSRAYVHDLATGEEETVSPLTPSTRHRRRTVATSYSTRASRMRAIARSTSATVPRDDALVSRGSGSTGAAADAGAWGATISDDGRSVVFMSYASNLARRRHARGRCTSATSPTTRRCWSAVATVPKARRRTDDAEAAGISANGRFVGFTTTAVNLGGPTFLQRAYVRDTLAGTTRTVDVPTAETDVVLRPLDGRRRGDAPERASGRGRLSPRATAARSPASDRGCQ